MANKWTKEQQKAIDIRDKNILVSAAAGSGKTAVLTQRIIQLIINEKIDINTMMIVTFTDAAANEMKTRIKEELYKKIYPSQNEEEKISEDIREHLKNQLLLLSSASISTMHSFCIGIIRENFNILDIDPIFSVGNSSSISMLKDEAMQELFEDGYEKNDELFLNLVDNYSYKNEDKKLISIIYQLHSFIQSKISPFEWLYEQCEKYKNPKSNIYIEKIIEDITENIENIEKIIDKSLHIASKYNLPSEKTILDDKIILDNLKNALNKSYDKFVDELDGIKFSRYSSVGKKADEDDKNADIIVKRLRDELIKKQGIEKLKSHNISSDLYKKYMEDFYVKVKTLCELVEDFEKRYKDKKREKNIFDFNDLEHYAIQILKEETIQKKIKSKYSYIFYDEYQDTNEVQDFIIKSTASYNNLFLVGDVKQSIYGFRLADPSIFIEKYENYPKSENSVKIDLSHNFRSDKNILDFCNKIFEKIMTKEVTGIEYDDSARLKTIREKSDYEKNIQINIVRKNEEDDIQESDIDIQDIENEEIMATLSVRQIKELIKNNNINYSDIAILSRSLSNSVDTYKKVFRKHNIPLFIDYSQTVFEVLEVLLFIDLLKIIDNINQDEPLISVLLSGIYDFDINDITKIRLFDEEEKSFYKSFLKYSSNEDELADKIKKFISKINHYADVERYMILDEFIDYVLIDSGYKDYVLSMEKGEIRYENLGVIRQKADEFLQNENNSLFNFLLHIDSILKNKSDSITPKTMSKEQNVVRFMSIHKSKGLEFPVVIINDLQKKFNFQDMNKDVVINSKYGIGVDYITDEYILPTMAKKVIKEEIKKNVVAEEIRVLYVALTRPKNILILNSTDKGYKKLIENIECGVFPKRLENIDNYRDMIIYALQNEIRDKIDENIYEYNDNIKLEDILDVDDEKSDIYKIFEENIDNIQLKNEYIQELEKKYSYKYEHKNDIQAKVSVTTLAKKRDKYKIENIINYKDYIKKSDFSPQKIGTLNHIFMQNINFKKMYTKQDLKTMLDDMIKDEFITQKESEVINIDNVYNFLCSDIGKRIQKSKKIYQEESFIMKYDGQDYEMINGIIDLFFEEDEHIVLLDYKTDNISNHQKYERANVYKEQIDLYKDAIKKAFGKEVKESYIYFLKIGQSVKVY